MTHLPLVPIYGGFPVKLITYIGKPIPFDESLDAESLAKLVARHTEALIEAHQPRPGNILRAITERVFSPTRRSQDHPCVNGQNKSLENGNKSHVHTD